MKRKLHYVLICILLIGITACEKEKTNSEGNFPIAIKSDFSERHPAARSIKYQKYPDDLNVIEFIDGENNPASIWYANDTWKMTYTRIYEMSQLPSEVQTTFNQFGYNDAQFIQIYKTEREGFDKDLYTFYFQYSWKMHNYVEHYVFINDDGLHLTTCRWAPNDTRSFIKLPQDHFDFIKQKYNGAEIRGYINNAGTHEYYIQHNDTLKTVTFRGDVATDAGFWKETKYELSINTTIPDNVLKVLKQNDPDFTYTNVYFIESDRGNAYFLQDKNRENELGYTIHEDIQPRE